MKKSALKERVLIEIQKLDNEDLIKDIYRLLELDGEDLEVYKLSEPQLKTINEAKNQVKNGQFLSGEDAEKDIDEWLDK